MKLVWLVAAACGTPTSTPVPEKPPTPRPVAWWQHPPIAPALATDGCRVDAGWVAVSLSVNGKPDGVFVRHAAGVSGEVIIAAKGPSSAKIALGAAALASPIDLESTWFRPRVRPPRLAGIFDAHQGTEFRIVDPARLMLEPGPDRKLAWVTPPTYDVPCGDLAHAEWPQVDGDYDHPVKRIPKTARLPLRATVDGPVIATATGIDSALVLQTRGRASRIYITVDGGTVTAWTQDLPTTEPVDEPTEGGGGVAFGSEPKLTCEVGTELFVRNDNTLYIVGALAKPRTSDDWRFKDGKIVLEGTRSDDADAPFYAVADSFSVTNDYSANAVEGILVPKSRCTKN